MEKKNGNVERERKWLENEKMERKLRENGEMERERENGERIRKWRCNGEKETTWRGSKSLSPFLPLSISPFSLHFLISSFSHNFLSIFSFALHLFSIFSLSRHFIGQVTIKLSQKVSTKMDT